MNEKKIKAKKKKSKDFEMQENREQKSSYDESRNVTCFNCQEKKHYVNKCSNLRQLRKMSSSSITTQAILSQKDRQNHLMKCVLFDSIIMTVITKSEEIRKKKTITQVKKKRTIVKKNKRINKKHDKYVKNQEKKNKKNMRIKRKKRSLKEQQI